jgi:hypothetical protein
MTKKGLSVTWTVCSISLSHFLLFLPACGSQAGLLHSRQFWNGSYTRTPTFFSYGGQSAHLPAILNPPPGQFSGSDKPCTPALDLQKRGRRDTLTLVSLGQGLKREMITKLVP